MHLNRLPHFLRLMLLALVVSSILGAVILISHVPVDATPACVGGTITEFPLPTTNASPNGIITGPDGNLWFLEHNANKIGKITPNGQIP
jgi:hypothetical protein